MTVATLSFTKEIIVPMKSNAQNMILHASMEDTSWKHLERKDANANASMVMKAIIVHSQSFAERKIPRFVFWRIKSLAIWSMVVIASTLWSAIGLALDIGSFQFLLLFVPSIWKNIILYMYISKRWIRGWMTKFSQTKD